MSQPNRMPHRIWARTRGTLAAAAAPLLASTRDGITVEATRDFIRFHSGRFDGRYRWTEYAAFIEPQLEPSGRERIYRLWVQCLNANPYRPLWPTPVS
jgi:hypothetical protein